MWLKAAHVVLRGQQARIDQVWKKKSASGVAALILLTAARCWAAVPTVVSDAQQNIGTSLYNPQSIAVAPNGTVYAADTNNNRIVKIVPNLPGASTQTVLNIPGITLDVPQAVAIDSAGDLFISDLPTIGLGTRIIEVLASGTVKTIYQGLLNTPLSMVAYGANTLLVGDTVLGVGAVYAFNVAATNPTPARATISGLPNGFTPAALTVDAAGNLYLANSGSSGGVYVAPYIAGGTSAAQPVLTGSFSITQPKGVAVDNSGNLFIAYNLADGTSRILAVPNASATVQSTPYFLPVSNVNASTGMAIDASGNLDVAEIGATGILGAPVAGNGYVLQLNFLNPVYLGSASVFGSGPGVVFNFAFNTSATLAGFRAITTGDPGTAGDISQVSSTCASGAVAGTASAPYTCYATFRATPQFAGMRVSAVQAKGSGTSILCSQPVYEVGNAAAQVTYPLNVGVTQLGLIQPQGVAISGFDQTVYTADLSGGKVYAIKGLSASTATVVSTGGTAATTLAAPSAVAINGQGDLFIADFSRAQVVVVPTTTGVAPFVLNAGSLLQHPISLALDQFGNVFIGDAGPAGNAASSASPGFVVVVPYKGTPFKLSVSIQVVFPQALAVNFVTGDLLIGDGGDASTFVGQIVKVSASGTASLVSITNPAVPTDPSGLTVDAAGNLYVLDGFANTITVLSPNGSSALLNMSSTTALNAGSAIASSAGSQSFVVTNLGGGTANSLVYLNGNNSSLAFGNQAVNTTSASQNATIANIGNQTLTLNTNFYAPKPIPGFALSSSETCVGGQALTAAAPACLFSLNFAPTTAGATSQNVSILTNAYNSGTPVLTLTGTGTGGSALRLPQEAVRTERIREELRSRTSRKSFANARRFFDR